jgi:sphingolipid delta-4 desaturase
VAFNVFVYVYVGPKALAFFALSLYSSMSVHPLGARWVQEHYFTDGGQQETFSYYGPLNRVMFNVGYHAEHHDFTGIPWNNLPRLRRIAAETYDGLDSHRSLARLLGDFLFNAKRSLYFRVLRDGKPGRGEAP